jgi:hypothetical protein
MNEMISLDLGKGGAAAYWDFSLPIKKSCYHVYGWDLGDFYLTSKGLYDVVSRIEDFLKERRGDISVEKPGRHLPYQWVLYTDIKSLANKYKVGYHEYHPITIKKIVTGSGRSEKSEIQKVLKDLLTLKDSDFNEHMHDAVATGVCHLKKVGML